MSYKKDGVQNSGLDDVAVEDSSNVEGDRVGREERQRRQRKRERGDADSSSLSLSSSIHLSSFKRRAFSPLSLLCPLLDGGQVKAGQRKVLLSQRREGGERERGKWRKKEKKSRERERGRERGREPSKTRQTHKEGSEGTRRAHWAQ